MGRRDASVGLLHVSDACVTSVVLSGNGGGGGANGGAAGGGGDGLIGQVQANPRNMQMHACEGYWLHVAAFPAAPV
jgi:hypothetical protein